VVAGSEEGVRQSERMRRKRISILKERLRSISDRSYPGNKRKTMVLASRYRRNSDRIAVITGNLTTDGYRKKWRKLGWR
jgi:hypothetical protein